MILINYALPATCFIIMEPPVSIVTVIVVLYFSWTIASNSFRIQKKFTLTEAVRLDDLTSFQPNGQGGIVSTLVHSFTQSSQQQQYKHV